jgi:hypothetical protein
MKTRNKTYETPRVNNTMIENNTTTKNIIKNKDITSENITIEKNTTVDCNEIKNEQVSGVTRIYNFYIRTFQYLYLITNMYVLWICLHYVASHLYIHLCVHKSFWGFITSPFMIITPQCQVLRWIIYNGANMINNMWIILGSWISSLLLSTNITENIL